MIPYFLSFHVLGLFRLYFKLNFQTKHVRIHGYIACKHLILPLTFCMYIIFNTIILCRESQDFACQMEL